MKLLFQSALAAALIASTGQADIHVTNCNDGGPGSLREAIIAANLPGPDDIVFDVSCNPIYLTSDLPAITDADTRILGDTAPDDYAGPDIILEASGATNGLTIDGATGCLIRGIRVQKCLGWGIGLQNGAAGNQIGGTGSREEVVSTDNLIGLRLADAGTTDNRAYNGEYVGNAGPGVAIVVGASGNFIGGLGASERNVINNNSTWGVRIESPLTPTTDNVIEGNSIGTDAAGTAILGNTEEGVRIVGVCMNNRVSSNLILHNLRHGVYVQASSNQIGPDNRISGNAIDGVHIGPGGTVQSNVVTENWIGLDPLGMGPVPNGSRGIVVRDGASLQEIRSNVISGNVMSGIAFFGNDPHHNLIEKNWIGLDALGMAAIPNGLHGIHFDSVASENTMLSNVIAANMGFGIYFQECGSDLNVVQGNYIGTLPDGVQPLGNALGGIRLESDGNLIGGLLAAEANVICANGGWGVEARGPACGGTFPLVRNNHVVGNRIGVALDGSAQGNAGGGVLFADAMVDNWVGDYPSVVGAGNQIRHNGGPGVQVGQPGAANPPVENKVLTNSISQNGGLGIRLIAGGNDLLTPPAITAATTSQVDGTNTLAGCGADTLVQVFYSNGNEGAVYVGQTYVASTDAVWTVVGSIPSGVNVTATNTSICPARPTEQTSGFSPTMSVGLGLPYCFGDGSGAACPCLNFGGAGEGCANGSGSGAVLSASGSASVAADDLVLSGTNLVPNQPGLYFQGDTQVAGGNGVSFGDGLRCAGTNIIRIQIRPADAMGQSSTTASIVTNGAVSPGDVKYYQLWYRSPGSSPCGDNFNLTQGLKITWSS